MKVRRDTLGEVWGESHRLGKRNYSVGMGSRRERERERERMERERMESEGELMQANRAKTQATNKKEQEEGGEGE